MIVFRKRLGIVCVVTALSVSAQASPQAVVELFTSQACSACPPADRALADLAREPGIVALTLPVDYWDYLGWKDTLAQTAFSARQRAYAQLRGDRQVYTPQMVVNGAIACVGSDRAKVERTVGRAATGRPALPVEVALSEVSGALAISVGSSADPAARAEVWVLPVAKAREVAIGRGENGGRTATYVNVVRGLAKVGEWRGVAARFEVPLDVTKQDGADAYVVLLQTVDEQGRLSVVLGAAKSPGL